MLTVFCDVITGGRDVQPTEGEARRGRPDDGDSTSQLRGLPSRHRQECQAPQIRQRHHPRNGEHEFWLILFIVCDSGIGS